MRVRIVRKLADCVDGIDLTNFDVGEVIELPEPEGRLIVAEEWAVYARRQADEAGRSDVRGNGAAVDRRQSSSDLYQRLKAKREEYERRHLLRRESDAPDSPAPSAA